MWRLFNVVITILRAAGAQSDPDQLALGSEKDRRFKTIRASGKTDRIVRPQPESRSTPSSTSEPVLNMSAAAFGPRHVHARTKYEPPRNVLSLRRSVLNLANLTPPAG